MNLGELRLKALQSLKRPYSSVNENSNLLSIPTTNTEINTNKNKLEIILESKIFKVDNTKDKDNKEIKVSSSVSTSTSTSKSGSDNDNTRISIESKNSKREEGEISESESSNESYENRIKQKHKHWNTNNTTFKQKDKEIYKEKNKNFNKNFNFLNSDTKRTYKTKTSSTVTFVNNKNQHKNLKPNYTWKRTNQDNDFNLFKEKNDIFHSESSISSDSDSELDLKNDMTDISQNRRKNGENLNYSDKKLNLDDLLQLRNSILEKLDENQSILAATEDSIEEFHHQLNECRGLHRKCERERYKLNNQLEILTKIMRKQEKIDNEKKKKVICTNYKKEFLGKMYRETYLRSLRDWFNSTDLYKIYRETLKLSCKEEAEERRIKPQVPFCPVELEDGKCEYRETCTMQHIEGLQEWDQKSIT